MYVKSVFIKNAFHIIFKPLSGSPQIYSDGFINLRNEQIEQYINPDIKIFNSKNGLRPATTQRRNSAKAKLLRGSVIIILLLVAWHGSLVRMVGRLYRSVDDCESLRAHQPSNGLNETVPVYWSRGAGAPA